MFDLLPKLKINELQVGLALNMLQRLKLVRRTHQIGWPSKK